MIRVCPERDAACPHGLSCPYTIDRYQCDLIVEARDAGQKAASDCMKEAWAAARSALEGEI